jgi:hypothetical protein
LLHLVLWKAPSLPALLDFAMKQPRPSKIADILSNGFSCQAKIFEDGGLAPANDKSKAWRENTRFDASSYRRVMLKATGVEPASVLTGVFMPMLRKIPCKYVSISRAILLAWAKIRSGKTADRRCGFNSRRLNLILLLEVSAYQGNFVLLRHICSNNF